MRSVTIHELRDRGEEIVELVESGESVTVTRSGAPVAEIRPLRRRGLDRATLLERWRRLPAIDPAKFREEVDAGIDGLEVVAVPHPDAGPENHERSARV